MKIDPDLYMEQNLRRCKSFATIEAMVATKQCFAKLFKVMGAPTAADFRVCIAKAEEVVCLLEIDEVAAEKNVQIWRERNDKERVGRSERASYGCA